MFPLEKAAVSIALNASSFAAQVMSRPQIGQQASWIFRGGRRHSKQKFTYIADLSIILCHLRNLKHAAQDVRLLPKMCCPASDHNTSCEWQCPSAKCQQRQTGSKRNCGKAAPRGEHHPVALLRGSNACACAGWAASNAL